MKKIKLLLTFSLIVMMSGISIAQELHNAKVLGVVNLSSQDFATIIDLTANEVYKTALYGQGLLIIDENIQLSFTSGSIQVVKSGINETIFAFQEEQTNLGTILAKYSENLMDNVDSILVISKENSLYLKAIQSDEFITSEITSISNIIGVYYYSNGYTAVLISDVEGKNVFTYLMETENQQKVEVLNASFSINSEENITPKVTIISSNSAHYYDDDIETVSPWGACMRGAMVTLYDDWDDDPLGTAVCWLTGPLCVIGGGLACAIQTW